MSSEKSEKQINDNSEPKKWKQLDELVQLRSNESSKIDNTLSSLSRPLLVLQQAEHESFEEIEHSDELNKHRIKDLNIGEQNFKFKLWCPSCSDDKNLLTIKRGLSSESVSSANQYITARSRSVSASSYINLSSLSSENTPKKIADRRYSAQSTCNQTLVISPRFSSTKRKSIREKQINDSIRKAVSSSNLISEKRRRKSSSPSICSRSKTTPTSDSTSNSVSMSTMSNLEQFDVETFLKRNKETGSIKQLTVISVKKDVESKSIIKPPSPPARRKLTQVTKSSIKKRLTCICKQESVDSGGSQNIVKIEEEDKVSEGSEVKQQLMLPSPDIGTFSNAVLSSPVQSISSPEKTQFTVQSKSEQTLRPIFSIAGQQRRSFNAMSDYSSVKPITDSISKSSFRRNSLQTTTATSTTGLSRLLSADLSSAEFYASTGWPKIPQKKDKLASTSISPFKGLPSESIVIEEEKDSERDSQASVIAPLLSDRFKIDYDKKEMDEDEKDDDKDKKQLELPAEEDEDDSDYDDYDYDIEENFKYAKRDSQISQTIVSHLEESSGILQAEASEKKEKLSRSKKLTQKGKKVRKTVFKLSKRIKRKLNGSDKSDEKSQATEIKEDKPIISFLDRLTPSPRISKHISSNKSSINEPSQEYLSCLSDREGSSYHEEIKEEKTEKQIKQEDKKETSDENYQNTKKKLLSRPRALSNIAASLRFAPIPAIAVAGFTMPSEGNLMNSEFYSKNKKKDAQQEEIKKPIKRTDAGTTSNLLTATFPIKSRKSPMRASYHGKTNYSHGYDKKLLRADAFNVRLQKGGLKRTAENTESDETEVVGSAESLVSRVLQEQGLGEYCDEKLLKATQKELAEALNMTQIELDRAAYNILQAETHLLGGDLLELMSQQHELQMKQASQENERQQISENIAHQLNPSICELEEEQPAGQADVFLMKDGHSPISFSDSDDEEDTKL